MPTLPSLMTIVPVFAVKGEMQRHKQHCSFKRHSRGVVLENLRLILKKNLAHAKADVLSV